VAKLPVEELVATLGRWMPNLLGEWVATLEGWVAKLLGDGWLSCWVMGG
jgi:hypothetical protein